MHGTPPSSWVIGIRIINDSQLKKKKLKKTKAISFDHKNNNLFQKLQFIRNN